jgi:acid phosphatase type 7
VSHRYAAILLGVLGASCALESPELPATFAMAAAIGPASVTTSASAYGFASPVVVMWSGLHGNPTDWIALAPTGSALTTVTRWAYVATASGSRAFESPVAGGSYVARAFKNDRYALMGESDPFTVADAGDTVATVAFGQASYAIDEPITVSWTGLPPNALDWVAIAPPGAADSVTPTWLYTGGAASGSVTFEFGMAYPSWVGFAGGSYVARLYLNGSYTRVAESAPVLIGSLVTTSAATYAVGGPITVSWTHLPGGPDDWIGLSPAGANPEVVTRWLYARGAVDGRRVFSGGLAVAGSYVARTYTPSSYFISGQSAVFTVTPRRPP